VSDLAEVLPGGPMSHRPSARIGYAAILLAAFLFGTNATASKSLLLSGIEATRLAELRTTGAFLIFAVILAIIRPSSFRVRKGEWPAIIAFGLIGVTLTQLLYFFGISRLPISIALLLEFTAPIMVALYWKFWLHKIIGRGVWLGLILALTGLAIVAQVWQGFHLDIVGVICGFGAAAALAVYYLSGTKAVRPPFNRDSVSLTMWGFAVSAAFWAIVQPWWTFPWHELLHPATNGGLTAQGVPLWVLVIWMVVVGTAIAFWLEVTALKNISATQVSTMGMLEPIFATAIAWILLGESLAPIQIAGGLIVLGGVYIAERSR
jgi:drug/metabolite transporter (DMT)-like permease